MYSTGSTSPESRLGISIAYNTVAYPYNKSLQIDPPFSRNTKHETTLKLKSNQMKTPEFTVPYSTLCPVLYCAVLCCWCVPCMRYGTLAVVKPSFSSSIYCTVLVCAKLSWEMVRFRLSGCAQTLFPRAAGIGCLCGLVWENTDDGRMGWRWADRRNGTGEETKPRR